MWDFIGILWIKYNSFSILDGLSHLQQATDSKGLHIQLYSYLTMIFQRTGFLFLVFSSYYISRHFVIYSEGFILDNFMFKICFVCFSQNPEMVTDIKITLVNISSGRKPYQFSNICKEELFFLLKGLFDFSSNKASVHLKLS